jgi:hypothetical protein
VGEGGSKAIGLRTHAILLSRLTARSSSEGSEKRKRHTPSPTVTQAKLLYTALNPMP